MNKQQNRLQRLEKLKQLSLYDNALTQSTQPTKPTQSIEPTQADLNITQLDPNIKTTSAINFIDQINKDFKGFEFKTDILIHVVLQRLKDDGILESELNRLNISSLSVSEMSDTDKQKILKYLNVIC